MKEVANEMNGLGNKKILASNLKRLMERDNITAKRLSRAVEVPYTTILSWLKADNYPRIDKIDALAKHFGVLKSELIEEMTEEKAEMQKKNDTLTDIIVRMRADDTFFEAVKTLYTLSPEKLSMLSALLK